MLYMYMYVCINMPRTMASVGLPSFGFQESNADQAGQQALSPAEPSPAGPHFLCF